MSGPAPTPTSILEARGSWRAKGREGEMRPPVKRPGRPATLSKVAATEWNRVIGTLEHQGVVAEVDRGLDEIVKR